MNRTTAAWLGLAAIAILLTSAIFAFAEPEYYDASSVIDYAAVVSLAALGVVNGIALILLWRDPPVARGSLFVLFAGIGAVAQGVGDLFEDAFGIEDAVWVWFGGGLVLLVSLVIAGIAALTVRSPLRWSGLFLLVAAPGAMYGFGLVMMGVSWFLFALWIVYQHRAFVVALAIFAVSAVATGMYLYGDDVVRDLSASDRDTGEAAPDRVPVDRHWAEPTRPVTSAPFESSDAI